MSKIYVDKLAPYGFLDFGLDVEYWNLSLLYFTPSEIENYSKGNPQYLGEFPLQIDFYSKIKFFKCLRKNRKAIYCFVDYSNMNDLWLLVLFRVLNIKYYVGPRRATEYNVFMGSIEVKRYFSAYEALLKCISKLSIFSCLKRGIYKIFYFIFIHLMLAKPPKFVVSSGVQGRAEWMYLTKSESYVDVPSVDVLWDEKDRKLHNDYVVFVDESVMFSPDSALFNGVESTVVDVDKYYSNLRAFFDVIEKVLETEVVVAASEKSLYKDESIFGGRKLFYGVTNELIQHAVLIVAHASSAIYQAVSSEKPVLVTYDSTFDFSRIAKSKKLADFLNVSLYCVQEVGEKEILNNLSVNLGDYQKIKENFLLTPGLSVVSVCNELIYSKITSICTD